MSDRHPSWETRLYAYLDEVRRRPWNAVGHNCALFALGAMRAVLKDADARFVALGLDIPRSEYAAARVLKEVGGVRGLAERFFGEQLRPALHARRGDVVLADGDLLVPGSEDAEALGIADGAQALFVGPTGIERHPLTACKGCWRAGQ